MILLILIALLIAIAIVLFNLFGKTKKTKKEKTTQDPLEATIDKLVLLNIKIRKTEKIDKEILSLSESIIDLLIDLIPLMNKKYSGTELTFIVNKMAKGYLPDLLYPYLKLSEENRIKELNALKSSLNDLSKELLRIKKTVESEKVSEFKTEAEFLSKKFFKS